MDALGALCCKAGRARKAGQHCRQALQSLLLAGNIVQVGTDGVHTLTLQL